MGLSPTGDISPYVTHMDHPKQANPWSQKADQWSPGTNGQRGWGLLGDANVLRLTVMVGTLAIN